MRLIPVQEVADAACYLYAQLLEREPEANISHKGMPTVDEHLAFVRSNPYADWCLIEEQYIVGATYLTDAGEIGIFIFKHSQGRGFGPMAVEMMMEKHPGRILANISPANERSRAMFEKLGFTLIQHTLEGSK